MWCDGLKTYELQDETIEISWGCLFKLQFGTHPNWYFWTFMGHWGLATFKMWGLASVAPAAAASFNQ
jgi:hypothetical protein